MKGKGLLRTNIILGTILIILIVVDFIIVAMIGVSQALPKISEDDSDEGYLSMEEGYWEWFEEFEEESWKRTEAHLLFTGDSSVQLIGDEYEDEPAWEGYQYYSVTVYVKNVGNSQQTAIYAPIYCMGESYDDVYDIYQWEDSESNFSYINEEMIPVGQTCPVEIIVRVKDGVREFDVIMSQIYISEDWHDQITVHLE